MTLAVKLRVPVATDVAGVPNATIARVAPVQHTGQYQ
jgi:hypothetical protein